MKEEKENVINDQERLDHAIASVQAEKGRIGW